MSTRLALTLLAAIGAVLPASAQSAGGPVRLRFSSVVDGVAIKCGVKYDGIGITGSQVSIVDFRFYVSKLRLLTEDGAEQAVALTQDGLWQLDDVALLDFEDGSSTCANGTEQTRDVVEGTVLVERQPEIEADADVRAGGCGRLEG